VAQTAALKTYLTAIKSETAKTDVWVVAYFHDYNFATKTRRVPDPGSPFSEILARYGVDLVLVGHDHDYYEKNRVYTFVDPLQEGTGQTVTHDYRVVVVGTGGFTDDFIGSQWDSPIHRPGFLMVEAEGNKLRYWKYDTHQVGSDGKPLGRSHLDPRIKEFRTLEKLGRGQHAMRVERTLNRSNPH
jgi:hypothetical protein